VGRANGGAAHAGGDRRVPRADAAPRGVSQDTDYYGEASGGQWGGVGVEAAPVVTGKKKNTTAMMT
jgi:hypothetical protein